MEDIVIDKNNLNEKDILSGVMHGTSHSDNKKERRKVNTKASVARKAGFAIIAGAVAGTIGKGESYTPENHEDKMMAPDTLNLNEEKQSVPVIILPGGKDDEGKDDEGMIN